MRTLHNTTSMAILLAIELILILLGTNLEISRGHFESLSQSLHQWCLSRVPLESSYRELYGALACGAQLPPSSIWTAFRDSGLLHLVVVSGSHLVLLHRGLDHLLRWSGLSAVVTLPVLGAYCLMTLLNPPVFRSLLSLLLSFASGRLRLYWGQPLLTALAGLICLLLQPDWATSWSLLLSWSAALVTTGGLSKTNSGLSTHILHFILLWPVLCGLGAPHPQSIIANWLLGPILGIIMFPLSLAVLGVPDFHVAIDPLWRSLLWTLRNFFPFSSGDSLQFGHHGPPLWCWTYLAALTAWSLRK